MASAKRSTTVFAEPQRAATRQKKGRPKPPLPLLDLSLRTRLLIFQGFSNEVGWLGLGCCRFDTRLEALPQLLELRRYSRDAVRIALTLARPIILVIILGGPPFAHRFDRRHNASVMRDVGARDRVTATSLLAFVLREDRRAILSPNVIALAIELCRVVDREEDVQEIVVAELLGVEGDPDCFCVARISTADLPVIGVWNMARQYSRFRPISLPQRRGTPLLCTRSIRRRAPRFHLPSVRSSRFSSERT